MAPALDDSYPTIQQKHISMGLKTFIITENIVWEMCIEMCWLHY